MPSQQLAGRRRYKLRYVGVVGVRIFEGRHQAIFVDRHKMGIEVRTDQSTRIHGETGALL